MGLATTAFPSGIGAIPIEVTENQCPLYFKRKEYLMDSAGAGEWRGGLSQTIEIANREKAPFTISAATFDRIKNPAKGRHGGGSGVKGVARLGLGQGNPRQGHSRHPDRRQPRRRTPRRRRLRRSPNRARALVEADVKAGVVSPESAKKDYFLAD